jgi:hypothetical protein
MYMLRIILLAVVGSMLVLPGRAAGAGDVVSRASADPKSRTIELIGHANPGPGNNADVFGHRGFAYLASHEGINCLSKGIRVFNLHNPRNPRLVSTFADGLSEPQLAGTWTEKVIVKHVRTRAFTGDLAAVSVQPCGMDPDAFRGFALYDVSEPARPRTLALYGTGERTFGSHELWLQSVGNHAYVYTAVIFSEVFTSPDFVPGVGATIPGTPDFRIVDVSDPREPVQVGEWGAWKELGVFPFDGLGAVLNGNFTHSVIVNRAGTRAYLSYWDLGTVILDITDPARPRYLGRTTFAAGEEGDAHSAALARGGRVLIETHETGVWTLGEPFEGVPGLPTLWSISDPAHPVRLAEFRPPFFDAPCRIFIVGVCDTVHDPKVRGGLAYFSWYTVGVVVADVSHPRRPRFVAHFVPPPTPPNPDYFPLVAPFCETPPCEAIWGVYVTRNYILASGRNGGLYVLRLR